MKDVALDRNQVVMMVDWSEGMMVVTMDLVLVEY